MISPLRFFSGTELSKFNSRFRQVDLLTEVGAPVVAGLLLAISDFGLPLSGFALIALWNLVSFFPEFAILQSVFKERPELKEKPVSTSADLKKSFLEKVSKGWSEFFRQPIAAVMIAYALLWLSVLSPHGVLLTGFLKDGWQVPEWMIGLFRGSGAFFWTCSHGLISSFAQIHERQKSKWNVSGVSGRHGPCGIWILSVCGNLGTHWLPSSNFVFANRTLWI